MSEHSDLGGNLCAPDIPLPSTVPSPEKRVKEALLTDGPAIFPQEEGMLPPSRYHPNYSLVPPLHTHTSAFLGKSLLDLHGVLLAGGSEPARPVSSETKAGTEKGFLKATEHKSKTRDGPILISKSPAIN